MNPDKNPAQVFQSGLSLTSQPLSTARWKASNCKGMTLRMPCKQSTEWGTLIVLFVFLMVSVSSLSQITTGRPWQENQSLVSKGKAEHMTVHILQHNSHVASMHNLLSGKSEMTSLSGGNGSFMGCRNLVQLMQLRNTCLSIYTSTSVLTATPDLPAQQPPAEEHSDTWRKCGLS